MKNLLALTTNEAVRIYFKANEMTLVRGLILSPARIRTLTIGAQVSSTAEFESDVSTSVLMNAVGGFAF